MRTVINQYIVETSFGIHVLYECENPYGWFRSTTGAFGQRDFHIEAIAESKARELISEYTKPETP